MSWENVEPVLTNLVSTLAADPNRNTQHFDATWEDRSATALHPSQRMEIELKVLRVGVIGADDLRRTFVPEDSEDPDDAPFLGNQKVVLCGQRRVLLRITVTPTEHTPDVSFMSALDRVRNGLERQSSIDALAAVGCGVTKMYDAINVTRTQGQRQHAKSVMDIDLVVSFADVDPTPGGWIETVLITSTIKGSSGQVLPVPPNVIDDVVTIAE